MEGAFVDGHDGIGPSRRFIDVRHIDREGLVVGESATVRHAHRHAVVGCTLIIQQCAISHRDLARTAVDRKPPPRVIR